MPIRVFTGSGGMKQLKASFKKNRVHYLQEALGLAIFMVSACYFSVLIFAPQGSWHNSLQTDAVKNIVMGVMMGSTALFIFYSPFTSPSGSQINPAVTLTFLRLGKMCHWDAVFYIIAQFIGGTVAVYIMQLLLGSILTDAPVHSAVTVPGAGGIWPALITEFIIAFITMTMVLFTSNHDKLKKYTRIIAGCFVCCWVIIAGPISGFGMNPARSFASALPANIYTAFWIYMIIPVAGMMSAAEVFLKIKNKKLEIRNEKVVSREW